MLVSQKIASNTQFLRIPEWDSEINITKEQIRGDVLRSPKFLVGTHLLNMRNPKGTILADFFANEKVDLQKWGKRFDIWSEFARLPMPLFCIENESGLMLVKQLDSDVIALWINDVGALSSIYSLCSADDLLTMKNIEIKKGSPTFLRLANSAELRYDLSEASALLHGIVLELLVYLNVSNITHVLYRPSRRELGKIPQVFKPFFEYRVVDIYRERKSFKSLEDVEGFINDSNGSAERRAHLVRGHFKNKNGKLFWWNSFMRNRKNIHTEGMIVHDYVVH